MIKTLRITSFLAVVLAGGVFAFAFPAFFGSQGDQDIEKFLNAPTVIDRFKQNKGTQRAGANQTSPLVEQAQAFALYLNPPPASKPHETPKIHDTVETTVVIPDKISAKFTLIATCVNPERPELSMVLIDQPGKGRQWVRQASEVGYLSIEQVKDGRAVVKGPKQTFELSVQRKPQMSLLLGAPAVPTAPAPTIAPVPTTAPSTAESPSAAFDAEPVSPAAGADSELAAAAQQMSQEEQAALAQKIFAELEDLARTKSDKTGSGLGAGKTTPSTGRRAPRPKTGRVTGEEAKKLDHLGRDLKDRKPGVDRAKLRRDLQERRKMLRDKARRARPQPHAPRSKPNENK